MVHRDRALSEIVGLMLISFLIIVLALVMVAALTGVLTTMLQKPALLTVTASPFDDASKNHIIRLYHQQGDKVNINGTSHTLGDSEIAITIIDPSGEERRIQSSGPMTAAAWGPGQFLYIYYDGTNYWHSDQVPAPASVSSMTAGQQYIVRIVDMGPKTIVQSLPVTIR